MNFWYTSEGVQISLDETVTEEELNLITTIFAKASGKNQAAMILPTSGLKIPSTIIRTSEYLTHQIFSINQTESAMMRYIKRLENKDLSLVHSMISLGSCTMKLNAATELIPVSWPEFSDIHPFVPANQAEGYLTMIHELEEYLCQVTGFTACSLQPNSGAQGEFAGLLTIKAYHESRGDHKEILH